MSIESISLEEAISRKSDRLSDYDRNIRLLQVEEHVGRLVDETCQSYKDNTVVISNSDVDEDFVDAYVSRSKGLYKIGLNYPFYKEFVTFKGIQNSEVSFEVIPKYRNGNKMLYDYTKHPNITFDALVRILTVVYRVVQKDKLRQIEEE